MQITDAHRKKLCELMYFAFLEIRQLGGAGKADQAADLADAFHNLPREMWKENFTLETFRDLYLVAYQEKYPGKRVRNYVDAVNEMLSQGWDSSKN